MKPCSRRDIAISCGELAAAAFVATETGRTVAPLINAFSGMEARGLGGDSNSDGVLSHD